MENGANALDERPYHGWWGALSPLIMSGSVNLMSLNNTNRQKAPPGPWDTEFNENTNVRELSPEYDKKNVGGEGKPQRAVI